MTAEARRSHALIGTLVFAVSAAFVLVCVELVLRWNGYQPWRVTSPHPNEPTIHVPDPVLGWKAKPGSYVFPPYTPDAEPIQLTFLPDGARATGLEADGSGPLLFFTGASFTQGWAVSDDETFARKVQERFSGLRVRNYGTGGYGTVQSLLSLERLLDEGAAPDWIFYSMVGDLERRNVATPAWMKTLALYSQRGTVDVPFCTVHGSDLVRHPPQRYPEWPLCGQLASVALAQEVYNQRRGRDRPAQRRAVTNKLLLEMRDLVESRGVKFDVVGLHFAYRERRAHYASFFRENRIDYVDCAFPLTRDMQVEGEGHANGKMHSRWADCIAPVIEKGLTGKGA